MNAAVALLIASVVALGAATLLWLSNRRKSFGDVLFARNKFGWYCIPRAAAHRPAALATLRGEIWETRTLDFMLKHAAGGVVVTAGAFFGDALPALSQVCKTVIAFEPNPENYRCAEITRLMNHCDNVLLYSSGLGERDDTKRLVVKDHQGRSLGGASQLADISDRGTESLSVSLTSIDATVAERDVTIIHLDVEGYEEYALRGAARTIARCKPFLILETVPPGLKGYSQQQIENQSYLLTPV